MPESYTDSLRRRAVRLVLEKGLMPGNVAKILRCSSPAVRRWVDEHLDQEFTPLPAIGTSLEPVSPNKESAVADSLPGATGTPFVPVRLEGDAVPMLSAPISLDILTRNGLTLRLQLPSVQDVAALLQSLEGESC